MPDERTKSETESLKKSMDELREVVERLEKAIRESVDQAGATDRLSNAELLEVIARERGLAVDEIGLRHKEAE